MTAVSQSFLDRLTAFSTSQDRTRGLLELGLRTADLAEITGVSVSAVRNWASGQAEPRKNPDIVLDDLRAAAQILLTGGLEPAQASRWLVSRDTQTFDNRRPIDLLPTQPMSVLAAAHEVVLERRSSLQRH